jgi:nucleotide-binding universal stress UspA family protein
MQSKWMEMTVTQPTQILPAYIRDFGACLAELLGSDLRLTDGFGDGTCPGWAVNRNGKEIFLPSQLDGRLVKRMLAISHRRRARPGAGNLCGHSLLLARAPRWPIRNILLVLRGNEQDQTAIDWSVEIAQLARARITILPIIPDIPRMYARTRLAPIDLDYLLLFDPIAGAQLQRLFRRLAQLDLQGQVFMHPMPPDEQIRLEVGLSRCDLLVISAEQRGWLWRCWMGELVRPLLRWIDRPALICKS